MPKDNFQSSSDSVIAPAQFCFDVSPSDSEELQLVTKAIYVGEGGDVTLRAVDNASEVTFRNVPSGAILDVRVAAVLATGTSASQIVGLA